MKQPSFILKKLILIIIIIFFHIGYILGQSISDFNRLKKQYEKYLDDQNKTIINEDLDPINYDDFPDKELIDLEDVEDLEDIGLKFFGYDFFLSKDSLLIWNNLPVPSSYSLGPGDEIIISLWGETQLRESATIGRDGLVYIERVGQLSLTGRTIEEAEKYLVKQFQKVYETLKGARPSTFMDVSLGQLKSINVTFVGEVSSPGVHPIHPFSTALTGLLQVGGIDTTGSLRNIQIIRSENDTYKVDFYKFLLSGKSDNIDIRLQDNDIVFIPPRQSRVEILGAVKRPGIYESYTNDKISDLWNELLSASDDIRPVGLGCRDSLRLEMGYCLYGHELNESINPIEAGLSWITKISTGFIGSESLSDINIEKKLVPLILKERAIPRAEYKIFDDNDNEIGFITSGAMSPSLQLGIALAYIDLPYAKDLNSFNIKIRNNTFTMDKTKLPFYKDGTYLK